MAQFYIYGPSRPGDFLSEPPSWVIELKPGQQLHHYLKYASDPALKKLVFRDKTHISLEPTKRTLRLSYVPKAEDQIVFGRRGVT